MESTLIDHGAPETSHARAEAASSPALESSQRADMLGRAECAVAAGERLLFAVETVGGQHNDELALGLFAEATCWALCAAAGTEFQSPPLAAARALDGDRTSREFLHALSSGGLPVDRLGEGPLDRAHMPTLLLRQVADRVQPLVRAYVDHVRSRFASPGDVFKRRLARAIVGAVLAGCLVLTGWSQFGPAIEERLHPNIALGKPWTSSSGYENSPTSGQVPREEAPFFFVTDIQADPWLRIDLLKATRVGGVTIGNRIDCCRARALPLIVEVSTDGATWQEVLRREDNFETWRAHFKPRVARFVRLRTPMTTFLHLSRVAVHKS
jgi:hypothetical protein